MLDEIENLNGKNLQLPFSGLGWSIVAKPGPSIDAEGLLARITEVWRVAAAWGRWSDDDLGDWPSLDQVKALVPPWLAESLDRRKLENWSDALHDRAWIWWCARMLPGNRIKIDLKTESLPISVWALGFVIDQAGGNIIYSGLHITDERVAALR